MTKLRPNLLLRTDQVVVIELQAMLPQQPAFLQIMYKLINALITAYYVMAYMTLMSAKSL